MVSLLGGAFLIVMGFYVFCKKRKPENFQETKDEDQHLGSAFSSALLLDLSNPIIILAYLAIFSGFGLANAEKHIFSAISLVIGVICGAALWWFLLTQIIAANREKLRPESIITISRVAGVLLAAFGLAILLTTFFGIPFFGNSL